MPRTPDRFVGPREEEEIQFDDRTADGPPAAEGRVRYLEQGLHVYDAHGVMNLRDSFARKTIPFDLTVPADVAFITRNPTIADGVTVTIESGGEMYVL